jgi:glycosyltransferase involved in cell wall biosynthesis
MVPVTLLTGRLGRGTGTGGVVWRVAQQLRERGYDVEIRARHVDERPPGIQVSTMPLRLRAPGEGRLRVAFDRVPGAEVVRTSGGVHLAWTAVSATDPWRRLRSRFGAERRAAVDEAAAYAEARLIVANSEKVARELLFFHGAGPEVVRVVRTGVDGDVFRPDAAKRRAARRTLGAMGRVAAFVGHSWRRKGLRTALDAFALAAGPRDALWVLGVDARALAWRATTADPRVVWLGRADPAQWLPGADAVLAPSRYDPASNVVLEALACGVPPVVSLADGSSEVVTERRLCVADPRSVQGFAEGLRLAWEDAALRERCREDGLRWPVPRMVDGLVDVIGECSGG